jgi:hypothetical protein
MPEKHLFEYAIIRVVPRVERGEFINVGVILYCASQGFLRTRFILPELRLLALCPTLDLNELAERLGAFERVCAGQREGGPIGQLPIAARFRWLTATRSTVLQTSPVHPGLCLDPVDALAQLFAQQVE